MDMIGIVGSRHKKTPQSFDYYSITVLNEIKLQNLSKTFNHQQIKIKYQILYRLSLPYNDNFIQIKLKMASHALG